MPRNEELFLYTVLSPFVMMAALVALSFLARLYEDLKDYFLKIRKTMKVPRIFKYAFYAWGLIVLYRLLDLIPILFNFITTKL